MNSVISNHSQLHNQRPSLHYLSKSNEGDLSKALLGSSIVSDKLKRRGVEIDSSPKSKTMFNRGNNSGSNVGGMGDKANRRNSSGFQQHQGSNNSYLNFAAGQGLVQGATGLMSGSSQTALHQQAQTQALAHHQQQQQQQQQRQRFLQMTSNDSMEVHKMASNLQETLMIKQRLGEIKTMESLQQMQQHATNKLRTELQMKAASQQATAGGIGVRNRASIPGGTKQIPSISNSSVIPTKQREDEMTRPDLSTLAETAVAVATAARSNTGMLGIGSVTKPSISNSVGDNRIAAFLEGRNSSLVTSKESSQSLPSSITRSFNSAAMTDILRRDLNATREKLHLEQSYKRSLDAMTKSNPTSAPSSWLWKSTALGNSTANISMEELREQHEQLQRRNSLPARSSISSDYASLRSMKRQRLLDEKASEIERLEMQDAMKRVRQLDAGMNMRLPSSSSSFLAEIASKIASQERRASIASSIASAGTSATAPKLTPSSALSSPVNRRSLTMLESNLEEHSKALKKLSKLGGGFPMPKSPFAMEGIINTSGVMKNEIPREVTPEAGKDIVDIIGRRSMALKQQLNSKHSTLGGFPMPPLYKHSDENQGSNSGRFDGSVNNNDPGIRNNNAISSHIRNNVNCGGTKVTRPPALESYKRAWREIRVVAGDDPVVDERLRREVFSRKLHRGEIFVRKMRNNNVTSNINNRFMTNSHPQQRHLSDLSHRGGSSSNTSGGEGDREEGSIII